MTAKVARIPTSAAVWTGIQQAVERLEGVAHRTPVMTCSALDAAARAEVALKCENLQRVGAFKFRGAYNAISRLSPEARRAGVITHSSGNHAQAVALVCRLLDAEATIVMPRNAPAIKRRATEAYGARIIEYDPETESREALTLELAAESGATLIPPFDHPDVVAGQGTVAVELFEATPELDALLVPCGGGGLLSGCAVAARYLDPTCRVIGVEPELADDATRSFYSGRLQSVHNPATIADGTRVSSLGRITFQLIRDHVADMCTVSERAICEAVRFLLLRTKILVEPSGALGVAALLTGAVEVDGKVGVVLSGGNVDAATLAQILVEQQGDARRRDE